MNRPFWSFRSSPQNHCDSIAPLLSAYADGMASPAEAERIAAHLPECEHCRAALSWMQATRTTLAARPVAVPPLDLHSRIALAIAASSPAPVTLRPARVFAVRTAYAAAASVTMLGIVLSYGLRHTPREVAVNHPAKPTVAATVPPSAVKPHLAPRVSARPLVASNSAKTGPIKHTVIARRTAPIAVTPPEHIASNVLPKKLLAVPTVITKAPVHQALPTQKIASRDITPLQQPSLGKHAPLPTVKTPAPTLPDTLKVAKVTKEPSPVHVDIQSARVTPDPVVQTASVREGASDNPLGPVLVYVKQASHTSLTAIRVPVSRSVQEAASIAQTAGSNDRVPVFGSIYSPK